jgi:zinc ribbon protein
MFCRFCGAHIADDSVFCAKCGKRLGKQENPRVEEFVRKFRLKTPYPYSALLIALFAVWAAWPKGTHADYSHLKWSFELDRKADVPDDHLYQQALSLVVENTGSVVVSDIPVELLATITPAKKANVEADFVGRRLLILQQGHTLPLTVIIGGSIAPAAKKRILLNGNIQAEPPFKVTYEVRDEEGRTVLASYVVEQE